MKTYTDTEGYEWFWCNLCRAAAVLCPKCSNNCCNGGYGTLPNGQKCDKCPEAYKHQDEFFFRPGKEVFDKDF